VFGEHHGRFFVVALENVDRKEVTGAVAALLGEVGKVAVGSGKRHGV